MSYRAASLCRDLFRCLEASPGAARDAWVQPLLESCRDQTGAAVAYLGLTASDGRVRYVSAGRSFECLPEPRPGAGGERLCAEGGSFFEPRLKRGTRFHPRRDGWPGVDVRGAAAVALPPRAPSRGWIVVLRTQTDQPFPADTVPLLELAAEAGATALTNERRLGFLEELAMTDGLTHIANYRHVRQKVQEQIALSLRTGGYFTVVMVDMDNLKAYNARHGHLAGSEVLQDLARVLSQNLRRSDLAAKYGGDEFLLVLPNTRPVGGVTLSERLRKVIGQQLRGRGGEALSASFGVAGFPEDGCDFDSLVRAADQGLFRAKASGRNAVVCAANSEPIPPDTAPAVERAPRPPTACRGDRPNTGSSLPGPRPGPSGGDRGQQGIPEAA